MVGLLSVVLDLLLKFVECFSLTSLTSLSSHESKSKSKSKI